MATEQTRRHSKKVALPVETWERAKFLAELHGADDVDDMIRRAIRYLDLASVPVMMEGAHIELVHKTGQRDRLDP